MKLVTYYKMNESEQTQEFSHTKTFKKLGKHLDEAYKTNTYIKNIETLTKTKKEVKRIEKMLNEEYKKHSRFIDEESNVEVRFSIYEDEFDEKTILVELDLENEITTLIDVDTNYNKQYILEQLFKNWKKTKKVNLGEWNV